MERASGIQTHFHGKGRGDLTGSENASVWGKTHVLSKRFIWDFYVSFSSYWFFEQKIKMQLLDDGFGKMPCLFWWVSSVKACLMWCISRYQGLKRTRVLLVLPSLPGWKRQALFIWWCLTYSASDSRKVQDAFGISLFGFESWVKIQNSESTRPSCIMLILCCSFI